MVSTLCYIIFPVVLIIGLLRKCREKSWGRCKDNSDLSDRIFIVTGANSGIGKETTKELVNRNATVIMACRNINNAQNAITDIRKTVTNGKLIPMELDLSSFASIKEFAAEIIEKFPKVHVLINNAGVYMPLKNNASTKDGFEIHFGVNHLAPFLLTNLLLDHLKKSGPSRIVFVSSKIFEQGILDFSNLNCEKAIVTKSRMNPAYGNSKLANVYYATELAKRTKDTDVCVYMVCPGFTYTGLFRHVKRSWFHYILFSPVALLFLRTAKQGAQTVLHCATDPSLVGESGNMYRDCKRYVSKKKIEEEDVLKLWNISERLTCHKVTSDNE